MDQLVRKADREEADRDQDHSEERVDGAHIRPRRARLDRVTEHEVGAVEEKEDEKEHELALAPEPPVAPGDLRPKRPRQQRERAEDDALVDGDVALQISAGLALPEVAECLPGAPGEKGVGRQRDRHVNVEDPLRKALVGVGRHVEEDQSDSRRNQHPGESGKRRQWIFPRAQPHGNACIFAEDETGSGVLRSGTDHAVEAVRHGSGRQVSTSPGLAPHVVRTVLGNRPGRTGVEEESKIRYTEPATVPASASRLRWRNRTNAVSLLAQELVFLTGSTVGRGWSAAARTA